MIEAILLLMALTGGLVSGQASSYDVSGGNADGSGSGIVELSGEGYISRIWLTGADRLKIEALQFRTTIDGVEMTTAFGGMGFEETSGGWVSYRSIPFAHSLRLELLGEHAYYQVTYQLGRQAVIDWQPGPTQTAEQEMELAPGQVAVFADLLGGGVVTELRLTAPEDVGLRVKADGLTLVNVPASQFFGGESLMMGRDWSRWPMPYRQRLRIVLTNTSEQPQRVRLRLDYTTTPPDPTFGYFAVIRSEAVPTVTGKPFTMLDLWAQGQIVGVRLRITGEEALLEGDEQFWIDDDLAIQGTGTEDMFNGGWYYIGSTQERPLYGVRKEQPYDQYRWYLADRMSFARHVRGELEHGHRYDINGEYQSLVFAYVKLRPMDER